jgi:hypothetical protein
MSIKNNMLYGMDDVTATVEALKILAPDDWERINDTGDGVSWEDIVWKSSASITEKELNTKVNEVKATFTNDQYKRDRADEYPRMQDQLDMQYHDQINSTTIWKDTVDAIKTKYPKP